MMFRAYPQHFRVALRAMFFLARHTAIVRHNRFAFRADALSAASHRVLVILFGHFVSPEAVPSSTSQQKLKSGGFIGAMHLVGHHRGVH